MVGKRGPELDRGPLESLAIACLSGHQRVVDELRG
jgi:hypothetical protein